MKIYPQTAPEIPTGESSIGWEAGGASWATVPSHHPPRGSGTVSANSPGSPGLRKQGPGRGGRVSSTGWSGHQHKTPRALVWPVPAQLGLQCRGRLRACKGGHAGAGQCLLCFGPFLQLQRLWRLIHHEIEGVRGCKSPWRGGRHLQVPPGRPPCCLDGDHYCFLRGRNGVGLHWSGPRERPPLFTPQNSSWALEAALKILLLLHVEGWEEVRLLGPHLRQIGRPKGGVGSSVCPSYLPTRVQTQSQDKKILW